MPRVKSQRANKDYPEHGIKRGDTYYKWSIRTGMGGTTYISKTYPKPSQLTNSKMSTAFSSQEGVEATIEEIRKAISDSTSVYSLAYKKAVIVAEQDVQEEEEQREPDELNEMAKDEVQVSYAKVFEIQVKEFEQVKPPEPVVIKKGTLKVGDRIRLTSSEPPEDYRKTLAGELESAADEIQGVSEEYQEACDNLDGKLNAEEMGEKADNLSSVADTFRDAASDIEEDDERELSELLDRAQEACDEMGNM